MLFTFLHRLATQSRRSGDTRSRRSSLVRRLEMLEPRELLATFTVTNTGENGGVDPRPGAGTGTLRQAIVDVNNDSQDNPASPDVIAFDIPNTGVHTILPITSLPPIVNPVVVDGYTQPGAKPNNLAVGDNAVLLIEIDASQRDANLPTSDPVLLLQGQGSITVRGLVINHFFQGEAGIDVGSPLDVVSGNFIGTDPSGTRTISEQAGVGVFVSTDSNQVGSGASHTTIGGLRPADRNLISVGNGFIDGGILAEGALDTVIEGNYIGTDASGRNALGDEDGILSEGSVGTTIGGTTAAARNVISGNALAGVFFTAQEKATVLEGNFIGVDATGTAPLGNRIGVILDDVSDITIGGTIPSAGNVIAYNGAEGVFVGFNTMHDPIRLNSVFSNQALGIDLHAGVSADGAPVGDGAVNDPQDKDTAPNDLQNFPVLAEATSDGRGTTISGLLNSTPNSGFLLDFYSSPADDSSQYYVGTAPVLTDGNGNATFDVTLPTTVPNGWSLTATATTADTAPYGDTSEFASPISVFGPTPVSVLSPALNDAMAGAAYNASLAASGGTGGPYSFAITAGAPPAGMSLSSSGVLSGTATVAATYSFTVTATDPTGITGSRALSLTVDAATASRLDLTGFPARITAGTAGNLTVTARDAFGNVATAYAGKLHFTSTDPRAALPADSALANGTGVLSVAFRTAGSETLSATDTVNAQITGSQTAIQVGAATTTKLVVQAPASATQGVQFTISVSAEDRFGNIVSGYAGLIHFSSTDRNSAVPADSGLNGGTGGFNVTLETAGLQTLTAVDTAITAITGTSNGIVVAGVKKMIVTHSSGASALAVKSGKMAAKSRAVRPRHHVLAGSRSTKRSQPLGQDLSRPN